ncbi:cation transporter [Nostoc flagelliforme FACHB-838]|uniref:Cation transporter n=1 Tax=Nostoc flagelliforme FACHB-838 TaxID=2692904 RepID=A0ABR8E2I3_9NOSO|nr:cation transporter [Nostoc flagelliforme]MBD2535937.1 cation transporter [Nostoc flagelliforme FACHB-838]
MQSNQVKQKIQVLWTSLVIIKHFLCVELSAGIWSNSLSLLADAKHILSDVAALGLALMTAWLSQSVFKQTVLDYYRLEVTADLINGIGLACVAGWIVKEL